MYHNQDINHNDTEYHETFHNINLDSDHYSSHEEEH
jgi:hypothetical protein